MATTASNTPALEISHLEAWYGESHVLHGVDIMVRPTETFLISCVTRSTSSWPMPCVGSSSSMSSGSMASVVAISRARLRP